MATKLFLRTSTANAIGTFRDMLTTAGDVGTDTAVVNTAASGTQIQWTHTTGGAVAEWISGRVPAGGFTLSGTMTFSIWAHESNMNANCGARARVFKRTAAGSESEIGGGPWNDGVEFGTAAAEMVWTGTPTSTAFDENDRIIVRYYITNIGTMASGHTCTLTYSGPDATTGDSFFQINENVTFKGETFPAEPDDATHAHSSTEPTITVPPTAVTPDNAAHGMSSTSPTLTPHDVVTIDSGTHSHAATQPSLAHSYVADLDDATHTHNATEPSVGMTPVSVDVDDATHNHNATEPSLAHSYSITVDNAGHALASDEPTLSHSYSINADNGSHAHSATQPALSHSYSVTIDDAAHSHIASQPTIGASFNISSDNSAHNHVATEPSISIQYGIMIDAAFDEHMATECEVTIPGQISGDDAAHTHIVSEPIVTFFGATSITPNDAYHGHIATTITFSIDFDDIVFQDIIPVAERQERTLGVAERVSRVVRVSRASRVVPVKDR